MTPDASMGRYEAWLQERDPDVPAPLLDMLLEGGEVEPGPGELSRSGEVALARALNHPGGERAGAFHLLVADALITYACEETADTPDPPAGLKEILEGLGKRLCP